MDTLEEFEAKIWRSEKYLFEATIFKIETDTKKLQKQLNKDNKEEFL